MIMFMYLYCSKGQGELLTRQMNAVLHPHHKIGVVLSGRVILHCHIMLTSLLPLLSKWFDVKATNKGN